MKYAHGFMALFFLGCAAVQFNDPDPYLWLGIYGTAAIISFAAVADRVIAPLASMLTMACLAGSTVLYERVVGKQALFESEEGREMMGLMLVTLWMGLITLRAFKKATATDDQQA